MEETGLKRVQSKHEGVDITTDAKYHKALSKRLLNDQESNEQSYANQLDHLEETENFLEIHNLWSRKREERENLNRPVTMQEIETGIKTPPWKQKSFSGDPTNCLLYTSPSPRDTR